MTWSSACSAISPSSTLAPATRSPTAPRAAVATRTTGTIATAAGNAFPRTCRASRSSHRRLSGLRGSGLRASSAAPNVPSGHYLSWSTPMPRLRFGAFLAPHHPIGEHPMLQFRRDLDLVEHLDRLGYDEFWCGEHHSSGWEMIASP